MLEDYDAEEQLLAERLMARWPRLTEAERNSLRDVLGPRPRLECTPEEVEALWGVRAARGGEGVGDE